MGDGADDAMERDFDLYFGEEENFDFDGDPDYVPSHPIHAGDPCPKGCGGFLVLRRNKTTGKGFLGCSSFPKCKGY